MFEGMRMCDKQREHGRKPSDLIPRLEAALKIARQHSTRAVDETALAAMAELGALLDDIDRCIPKIEAWCVVKHYNSPEWKPALWCAFHTKERAEAFAPVIAEAYRAVGKPWWEPERWLVERKPARLSDFIAASVTPEEYADEIKRYG
jgi:hypothetical protein